MAVPPSDLLSAGPAGPPGGPATATSAPPRGEQVEDQQQDCRPDDGGHPGGEVEEPVQGVHVEQLRRQPPAAERPEYPDRTGDDETLRPSPGDQHIGQQACYEAENNPGDDAHYRLLSQR